MATDPWMIDASGGLPSYPAGEVRLLTVAPFLMGAGASLGVRSGVRQSGSGTDLLVQAQSSPNMTVKVNPGVVAVQGAISTTQGPYTWALDATANVTIAAAHATLTRTDRVVVRIRDASVDTSGQRDGAVTVITGTAGGGLPSLPTDATYFELARVAVGSAVSTIVAGNITDMRAFTTGLGGILAVPSTSEPAAATLAPGQVVYRTDVGQLIISDGAAYRHVAWTPPYLYATKTTDDTANSSTTLKDDSHLVFTVPANSKWLVTSNVFYSSDSTSKFKMGWSGPASATFSWNTGGMDGSATSTGGIAYWGRNTIGGTDSVGGAGAPTPVLTARPSGLLIVAGTSGSFKFRWAQNGASANGVNTFQDSWMLLTRYA